MAELSEILLDVPLVEQRKPNTCWYAAACMVSYYYAPGPRLGIPEKWENNEPISPQEFVTLARNEGLKDVPTANAYTASDLAERIQKHGPIWAAGYWYGPGHIIVLTGVKGGQVHLNDPDGGVKKTATIDWFNKSLAKQVAGCLMCKDQARS